MPPRLSLVVLSQRQDFDRNLESSLPIEIRARVEQVEDLEEEVVRQRPDALLVALDEDPRPAFDALEKLPAPRPLLLFFGPDQSRLILQAMRCGAREYVTQGDDEREQLIAAIQRVARERAGSAEDHRAPLVAVMGAKGGVGASFVACQLSASLARLGGRVALVDGHLRLGDMACTWTSRRNTTSRAWQAEARPSTRPTCTRRSRRTRAASRCSPPPDARRKPTPWVCNVSSG